MGWGSGVDVAEDVWDLLKKYVPKNKRKEAARAVIEIFENHDCDTLQDSEELMLAAGIDLE